MKRLKAYNRRVERMMVKDSKTEIPSLMAIVKDWNYRDLSRATGLNPAHISNVMSGKRTPNLRTALKLSRALGVDLEKFALGLLAANEAYLSRRSVKEGSVETGAGAGEATGA